jgi:hypothetical protein
MLKGTLDKAIDQWHTVLGPRSGVRFMQGCTEICYHDGCDRNAVLEIQYMRTGSTRAPVGCQGWMAGKLVLYFNGIQDNMKATSDDDPNYFTLV